MSWELFGELRSALAAQDWQRVARLMDEQGGCDDERARRYAHDVVANLPSDQRPLRMTVGAKNVDRRPLLTLDALDLVEAVRRKRNCGGSYVLAPAWGYTPAMLRRGDWTGWNSAPQKISKPLIAARIEAFEHLVNNPPEGTDLAMLRCARDLIAYGKGAAQAVDGRDLASTLAQLGTHPRITLKPVTVDAFSYQQMIDAVHFDGERVRWRSAEAAALSAYITQGVGEVACRLMLTQPNYEIRTPEALKDLARIGRLIHHLASAAGGYIMPSPYVGGEPYVLKRCEPQIPLNGLQPSLFGEGGAA